MHKSICQTEVWRSSFEHFGILTFAKIVFFSKTISFNALFETVRRNTPLKWSIHSIQGIKTCYLYFEKSKIMGLDLGKHHCPFVVEVALRAAASYLFNILQVAKLSYFVYFFYCKSISDRELNSF